MNKVCALWFLLVLGVFSILPRPASAATEAGGLLEQDETLTRSQSPYIIRPTYWYFNIGWFAFAGYGLGLKPGVTLTIEPGVIVKFDAGASLDTGPGKLMANGTESEPIIFTAFADDSAGGDTNGDGNASLPDKNFWGTIKLGESSELEHSFVRYGAACVEYQSAIVKFNTIEHCDGPALQIIGAPSGMVVEENTLSDSGYGIFLNLSMGINVRRNRILDNHRYGIMVMAARSGSVIEGNEISDNDIGIYYHNIAGAKIENNNIVGNTEAGLLYGVIPGTDNLDARNNWWGDATGPFHPTQNPVGLGNLVGDGIDFAPWLGEPAQVGPKPIDPVIIIPGILGSSQKNGIFVIDPIMHVYDNLIETLEANGYQRGVDLFTFPYNWRDSNRITALFLRDKIDQVQQVCQCSRVDLVAHSMGGLVAREYIQSNFYEDDIDQAIFLGTPHLGAAKSYLPWEGAEVGLGLPDQILKLLLSKEAKKLGYSSLFDYIRNRPIASVQELLPVYDYLRDDGTGDLRSYPNNYPQNTFLENLKDNIVLLFNSGIESFNIIGDTGVKTISTIRVVDSTTLPLWEHGYPEGFSEKIGDRGLELGQGDGTVPEISSTAGTTGSFKIAAEHVDLVTKAEGIIFKTLTGNDPTVLIDKIRTPNIILVLTMLSPADFQVIAPDGKRIGKDFSTGQEINEVEEAFYSGFETDDEFITIPNPLHGEYQIITQGTDNGGSYTVSVGYITDRTLVETDFIAQTKPDLIEQLDLSLDNENPESLTIAPQDIAHPVIAINSPESRDYHRSESLTIDAKVTDLESGVFLQEIKFDDTMVNDGQTLDLFFQKLGSHKLDVKATDFVGNVAESEISFRVIATLQSTISDIQRCYILGWITDQSVKDSLISKLRVAVKQGKFDKVTAKSFMSLLDAQRNKSINEQAYQLLREDIYWLSNN